MVTLAQTAGDISSRGDYSLRAAKEGSDEVGSLLEAFNEMVGQVQRREAERTAVLRREQEANRIKDEFLATVSPRAADAAERDPRLGRDAPRRVSGRADARARSRAIERNARAQARLIEDLLDVSRIISGKLRLSVGAGASSPGIVDAALE